MHQSLVDIASKFCHFTQSEPSLVYIMFNIRPYLVFPIPRVVSIIWLWHCVFWAIDRLMNEKRGPMTSVLAAMYTYVVTVLLWKLSHDIMPKSIDQDGEAFGALRDTFLYLLWWSIDLLHDWVILNLFHMKRFNNSLIRNM